MRQALYDQAASLFQRIRVMESADENGWCRCISCGRRGHYTVMQGGHYHARGYKIHLLNPNNVFAQCAYCNGPLAGNPKPYRAQLLVMLGREAVEEMEATKHDRPTLSNDDLLKLIDEYKERHAMLSERLEGRF